MYYRIKAFFELGYGIHLHYFSYYNRKPNDELKSICQSIREYKRKKNRRSIAGKLPYIVASRIDETLIENLKNDNHPVLIEGVHCSGIINQLSHKRKIVVRLHNDEAAYYKQLSAATGNLLKKIYFKKESVLLKKYQQKLPQHCMYACITENDKLVFQNQLGLKQVIHLPAFIPFQKISCNEGMGNYALYHGNLSVAENEKAVLWLVKEVFQKMNCKLIIAGKKPGAKLKRAIVNKKNIVLFENPDEIMMNKLVADAHINILPSISTSGIKLKLLHALYCGRHCIVNENMIAGTGVDAACHIGKSADAMASIIAQLQHLPFHEEEIKLREKILLAKFNNLQNCRMLIPYL